MNITKAENGRKKYSSCDYTKEASVDLTSCQVIGKKNGFSKSDLNILLSDHNLDILGNMIVNIAIPTLTTIIGVRMGMRADKLIIANAKRNGQSTVGLYKVKQAKYGNYGAVTGGTASIAKLIFFDDAIERTLTIKSAQQYGKIESLEDDNNLLIIDLDTDMIVDRLYRALPSDD